MNLFRMKPTYIGFRAIKKRRPEREKKNKNKSEHEMQSKLHIYWSHTNPIKIHEK